MQPQATGYSSPTHDGFSASPSASHATLSDTVLSEVSSQLIESLACTTHYPHAAGLSSSSHVTMLQAPHERSGPPNSSLASAVPSYPSSISSSSSLYRQTSTFPSTLPPPSASLTTVPSFAFGARVAAPFPLKVQPALSISSSTPKLPPWSFLSADTSFRNLPSTNSVSSSALSRETVVSWSDSPQHPTMPAVGYGPQSGTQISSVCDIQPAHHFSHLHKSSLDNLQENHLSLFPTREDTPRNWQNFTQASGVTPLLPPLNYVSEMVPSMPWPVSAGMQGSISCSEFTADASESFNPTPQMNASGVFSSRNMSHADSHQPVFSPDVDARPMIQSVPSQANFDAAARGPYEPTRAMKRKASVSPPGKAEFNATWAADRGNGKVRAVDLDPGVEEMDEDGKKMWVLQLLSEEVKEHMEVSDIRKGPSEYDVLKTAFDVIRAWQDYDQQRAQQINAFQEALQVAQSHWLKEKVRREAVELRLVQTERDVMTLNTKVGKRAATIETATHDLEETKAGLRRSKDELHSKIDEAQRDVDLIKQLSADLVSTRAELQRYQERYAR